MATSKKTSSTEDVSKANNAPDRFRLGEIGSLGLSIFNGITNDELKKELNWPTSINTYKAMSYHGTVNSAMTLFDNIISKATWNFTAPKDATENEKMQAEIINSMMYDMEDTWSEFIRDALSMNIYGFSVHEKVYRRRLRSNGSQHNDNYIGWKKLPIRAQETIKNFEFTEDGNSIKWVVQDMSAVADPYNRYTSRSSNEVKLIKDKIMLFRAGRHRGDPFGKSPLREAYLAWRFLTALEDLEATSIAKDVSGLPVLYLPPQYLSDDASPSQKAIRQYYENAMRNLQMNQQSAMILPAAWDEASKMPMFKLELLASEGRKQFDISKVKEYYKNSIVTSLFSEVLTQGQSQVGSFALGSLKNSMSGAAADNMIRTIRDVIQRELIQQTYELNYQQSGWTRERMGTLDYDGLEDIDLESFSKAAQRYSSTGLLELDREVLNIVRESIGVDPLPLDLEPQQDLLTGNTSKSGAGFATAGEGTALAPSGTDTSSNNTENVG